MKIAIIRQRVGFGLGGAENYAAYVAQGLKRLGHEVTVIADYCDLPGVRFRRAPILGRGSVAKNLSFFVLVKRILKEEVFDLVYSCARTAPSDLVRVSDPLHKVWIKEGYRFGSPRLRALRPRHRILLWLEKEALSGSKRGVVTNSQFVKEQIKFHYQLPDSKIFPIYNGVDFSKFNLKKRKSRKKIRKKLGVSGQKVLLFVGHDWRRKGLDLIQKIMPKLPPEVILLVAGGKTIRDQRNIRYLGEVKNIDELYIAADLLVLPTRYDPFANVVLEALACGLPVVTSRLNGAAEIIQQGETGFVVEAHPESLLRAVSGLLASPPSPEACHRSVAHLNWENHLQQLLSLV